MINRFKWLEVAPITRKNLVIYLNTFDEFPKLFPTGKVEVMGNKVVCDGFTDQDLCGITPELLRKALGEHTLEPLGINPADIYAMFYELVRRLELPPLEINPVIESPVKVEAIPNTDVPKKKGRPKKI